MYKKVLGLILFSSTFVVVLSCGSGTETVYKSNTGSTENIKNISYFAPVYSFKDHESSTSRKGKYLVVYTNHAADSLFRVESERYRIRKKILPEDQEVSLKILMELDSLFEEVITRESIKDVQIPPVLSSLLNDSSEQYFMGILVTPEMYRQHSEFKSITYHLLIMDSVTDRVSFYGRSSKRKRNGYVERFNKNMEEIYKSME
ncbi:hypothetical protein HC174_01570 [Salinimicrobium sp. CDJ15-81-2]|nr:hypothetical protein [Salinimicrobium nanhaiense]